MHMRKVNHHHWSLIVLSKVNLPSNSVVVPYLYIQAIPIQPMPQSTVHLKFLI